MPERTKTAGVADARELAGWREFADRYLPRQASAKSGFVLFQARWRLAWSFERLGAPGYSGDVLDGYSIGFNLFHAYTAHEQLAKAVGRQHHDFPMEDAALAADVRKTLAGLHEPLLHEARPMQVELLSTFFGGGRERERGRPPGGLRSQEHGRARPFAGSKLRTKSSRAVVGSLAERILLLDEPWFGEWLDADAARRAARAP